FVFPPLVPPPPPWWYQEPVNDLAVTVLPQTIPEAHFEGTVATFSVPPSVTPSWSASVAIDWGDGNWQTIAVPAYWPGGTGMVNGIHNYPEKGIYPLRVEVWVSPPQYPYPTEPAHFGIGTATVEVTDQPVVPSTLAAQSAPQTVAVGQALTNVAE